MLQGRRFYGMNDFVNDVFWTSLVPASLIGLWLIGLIAFKTLQISLICCIIIFIGIPLAFKYSVTLQRSILFLNFVAYPKDLDYDQPDTVGLYATRNFYIKVQDPDIPNIENIMIGVWHVLPIQIAKRFSTEFQLHENALREVTEFRALENDPIAKIEEKVKTEFPIIDVNNRKRFFELMLRQSGIIILYLHGNTSSRGAPHRINLYKTLRKLGYHVLCIDYRGYGDSDNIQPTEEGVIKDVLAIYHYIRELTNNPVFLWGHSLGTGVASHFMAVVNKLNIEAPRAVFLESPFTNIREELREHSMSAPFRNLPWFDATVVQPMYANSLRFESDKHICTFPQPVMILHAEDDNVVPFRLGYTLYRRALDMRPRSFAPVQFERFDASLGYGHQLICTAPNFGEIVTEFIETYKNENFQKHSIKS